MQRHPHVLNPGVEDARPSRGPSRATTRMACMWPRSQMCGRRQLFFSLCWERSITEPAEDILLPS